MLATHLYSYVTCVHMPDIKRTKGVTNWPHRSCITHEKYVRDSIVLCRLLAPLGWAARSVQLVSWSLPIHSVTPRKYIKQYTMSKGWHNVEQNRLHSHKISITVVISPQHANISYVRAHGPIINIGILPRALSDCVVAQCLRLLCAMLSKMRALDVDSMKQVAYKAWNRIFACLLLAT